MSSDAIAGQPERQDDPTEHRQLARAVHPRGLEQLAGDPDEEVPQQEDRERQPERHVEQHHARDRAEQIP